MAAIGIVATLGCVVGCGGVTDASTPDVLRDGSATSARSTHEPGTSAAAGRAAAPPRGEGVAQVDLGGGEVPDGVTVFDDSTPAVTRLDPSLLSALRVAAEDAERGRVRLRVNSGWRSPAYQQRLLDEAITTYGSRAAAARWVATPETSPHVAGDAVDIGPAAAASWLAEHGAAYGLCRIYRNEPWHFELRVDAVEHGCPRRYADAAHDPRMTP